MIFKVKNNIMRKQIGRLAFTSAAVFITLMGNAQSTNLALSGIVTDKANQPLEGIVISIKELSKTMVTGEDGVYGFKKLAPGNYTICINGISIEPIIKLVTLNQSTVLNFGLESLAKELNAVTITASGIRRKISDLPGAISVIDARTIRESGAQSLTEIITRIPGVVAVDEDGRGLKPNFGLRGLDPNRNRSALILIDGKIPNGTMYYGDPGGYYMTPLQQIEKVEVIRGGSSVLYGGYSVGGVINLVSKKAAAIPTTLLKLNYGSWNALTAEINTSGSNGKFGYMINGVRRQGDGFRERSKFGVNDFTVKLENQIDATTKLSFYLNGFSENSQTPGGLIQNQYDQDIKISQHPFDHFKSDRYTATISLDKQLAQHQQINTSVYGNYFKRDWFVTRKKNPAVNNFDTSVAFIRDIHAIGIVSDYQNSNPVGSLENAFVAGVRLHTDRLNDMTMTSGLGNQEVGKASGFGISTSLIKEAYVYNTISFLPRLSFSLGGRYTSVNYKKQDYTAKNPTTNTIGLSVKSNSDAVVFSTGLIYKLNENNNVFVNVSRGFQPPAIYWALDANTVNYAGELKPETSMNYELGLRTQPAKWISANLTGYIIDYKNKFVQVMTYDNQFKVWQNVGTSSHKGVELELDLYPIKNISLYGSGAYQVAKQTSGATKDKYMVYAPKLNYTVGLRYGSRLGAGQFTANAWINYVGKQYTDLANGETATPNGQNGPIYAYHPANLALQYQLKQWGFNFNLNNVFDERYFTKREGAFWEGIVPMPGRNFMAGVSFKF
jgi:outer membrane receptor for Fe3+-dicitrate